jgi:hypothetical protein
MAERSGACAGFIGASLAEWAVMNNTNRVAHSNQNGTSQITVTTRDSRRHRGPLDNQHPNESMRRYAELAALKYQKMKENEPCPPVHCRAKNEPKQNA